MHLPSEQMQRIALQYLNQGYIPLRIDPDSKAARHQGWQIETPTEESIARSFARTSNIGLRCGDMRADGTCLVAIDIDIDDAELIRVVERAIGQQVPVKRGKKGATYFVRMDREVKTGKIRLVRDGKKTDAIDVLAKGAQTVVPPSVHPDTKLPYQWIAGTPIHEVDYRSLPIFGPTLLDEIRGWCKEPQDCIAALNDMVWAGVGGGGNTHDTCVAAVASMVARKWPDADIHDRVQRAKREACEAAGTAYDWPDANRAIQEWIDSCREKSFDKKSKVKIDDIPLDVVNRYVYVANIDRMYDLKKGVMLNKHVFDNMHARDMPNPWQSVLKHPDFRLVDRLTYSPGQPQFCQERSLDNDAVLDCLNVYSGPDVWAEEGDVDPFVQLVRDVFDHDEGAIHHVLSFFAYAVQNPGARINHALVIQGEQGIGKDSLLLAIDKVIGYHNMGEATLANIESQFNDWLFGKQLIVFQEVLATGRRAIYNKLKPVITNPIHTIHVKFMPLQRVPNRAVYVFLTNYKHALSLDPGDRRMWVWYSKMQKKSPEYYRRYYDWLADPRSTAALTHFLLNYDTKDFQPSAPPPMTDSKKQLIEASSSEIEQYLRAAIESGTWPMRNDLVNVPHLHAALRGVVRTSLSMITEALDNIVDDNLLSTRPRVGSSRLQLRAVRNVDKWRRATASQLAAAYRIPLPPSQGETEGTYMNYGDAEDTGEDSQDSRF